MHNDEAVNAVKFGQLWEHGAYKYDPNEHHGPALPYATLAVARLTSTPDFVHLTEIKLRLITVAFGLGLVLLVPLIADGLGRKAAIWAAIFTAVSPAFVFYSRYYIHEILLVFFTFLALGAVWRYWRARKIGWALLAGAGLGLMHSTKETFVITLASAGMALALSWIWERWLDASTEPVRLPRINWKHLGAGLFIWIAVWLVLFSSFFTNWDGLADSVRTYLPWLHRAGGASPHINPWYFYFHRLLYFHVAKGPVWTEASILVLAAFAAIAAFARKGLADGSATFVRFISLYTLILMVAYCFISYKTPWCLLSFWHGTILLAGVGAGVVIRAARHQATRAAAGLLVAAATAHLACQAWQASVPYAADQRNPYVYAQTSPNILELVVQAKKLALAHPEGNQMLIKVMAPEGDFWPLPWYLRAFNRAGWWEEIPADPYAPVMIVSTQMKANLDEKKTHLMVGIYQLRPQVFFELYVELNLWKRYLGQSLEGRKE
jgi:uncharacterized protein (TIGR03663 family)